jgi:glycosyltransferase involved in cell wall biosynthesis
MDLDIITPLIITYNEAPNIARTLDMLRWAKRIVVIDSGSTDGTLEIARKYPQVEVTHRPFDDFANQCNFGLERIAEHWVLSLDADYVLSEELIAELQRRQPAKTTAGLKAAFVYCIYGRPLRASLYPPRTVLYRRERAYYRNEGHGHRVVVAGTIEKLSGCIYHDDRKPLSHWLASQQRYAALEAQHLLIAKRDELSVTDRIRLRAWPAPLLVFLYTLIFRGCILDGWPGWFYVLQRTLAEIMIAIEIIDRRLRTPTGSSTQK